MTSVLEVDRPAPAVRLLTLNRPDRMNAMTAELCEALHVELRAAAADRSTRAIVITGAGCAFCVGRTATWGRRGCCRGSSARRARTS